MEEDLSGRERSGRRGLLIAISVTLTVLLVEVIGGLLSNSLALLSDAGHMFVDASALILSLLALRFATRPPTTKKTFGFYRLEIIAALINGFILILVCAYIFYEAYQRFIHPQPVRSLIMLVVASVGLVANTTAALALAKSSRRSLNIRAAFLHILGDTLSSIGVVIGGLIILYTGWYTVDPLIGLLIGIVIVWGAARLVSESVNILLEAVPKEIKLEEVLSSVKEIEGVRNIHDVHLWTLTSGVYALSAHVLIDDVLTSHTTEILEKINRLLQERYKIQHTTLQFECEACDENLVCRLSAQNRDSKKAKGQ